MNGEYAALAGRIRESLAELARVVDRAETLRDKAQRPGDDGYWDGVVLNLRCSPSAGGAAAMAGATPHAFAER